MQQIQNFRSGRGLILSVHIVHHAGTAVCNAMKAVLPAPSFACMIGQKQGDLASFPCSNKETKKMIESVSPVYRFISWEFWKWGKLHQTNWEDKAWFR